MKCLNADCEAQNPAAARFCRKCGWVLGVGLALEPQTQPAMQAAASTWRDKGKQSEGTTNLVSSGLVFVLKSVGYFFVGAFVMLVLFT